MKFLSSEDQHVRSIALAELPKYGNRAVGPLLKVLMESRDQFIQKDVIHCLGDIRTAEAASGLMTFFKQTHDFPNEITSGLILVGKPGITVLFDSYNDNDPYVRLMSLDVINELSLTFLTDENMLNKIKFLFLRAFKNDSSISVRKTALNFLLPYKDQIDVKAVLENALKDKSDPLRGHVVNILKG